MMVVVKKQAATPRNRDPPKSPQAGKDEKTKDPKASMVVNEVSKIAFPVLEKTV